MSPTDDNVTKYGFTAVPRDPDVLFKDHPTASGPNPRQASFKLEQLPFPETDLVRKSKEFVKKELNPPTYNHSHRVYLYGPCGFISLLHSPTCQSGTALVRTHFPEWKFDDEAYYLTCLFHDLGTADRYLSTTKMSFEFKGAIVAREFLLGHGADADLADGVCEVRGLSIGQPVLNLVT